MRTTLTVLGTAVFAMSTMSLSAHAAKAPAVTKMGCKVGKEKWDASAGKCVAKVAAKAKAAPKRKTG